MANRRSLAVRPLWELTSNFFIVALDFMTKQKLEGKLGTAYRLVPGVVRHDRRAGSKRSSESLHVAWSSLVGEHALVHDRKSTRRLSDSGKSVSADFVDEAHSLVQGDIVAIALGGRSSTTLSYKKNQTQG